MRTCVISPEILGVKSFNINLFLFIFRFNQYLYFFVLGANAVTSMPRKPIKLGTKRHLLCQRNSFKYGKTQVGRPYCVSIYPETETVKPGVGELLSWARAVALESQRNAALIADSWYCNENFAIANYKDFA